MRAFITGVTGQDGWYLSKLLLEKGYEVYGLVRRSAQEREIPKGITVVEGDVTDPGIIATVHDIWPHEIYHLAAMSHVGHSFNIPHATFQTNAIGTLNLLEAAKAIGAKFYQASTSELFGDSAPPQNEATKFHPRSPYAIAKLAAYWLTVNYREAYGLYACNGILFNHESPRRGADFVTQKVAQYCARFGRYNHDRRPTQVPAEKLKLGNLDARRDWGHAEDFVRGMWLMLQQKDPDDYVLATGRSRMVRELLDTAFSYVGVNCWTPYVEVDPTLFRPTDVDCLRGDATKALDIGWERKISFKKMIGEMIDAARSNRSTVGAVSARPLHLVG